eukprot:TRINITY_DN1396_c0_g4_i1.p1 TRINITY_DN1396_c0_g4~~TRINITY_DN1396_c0_g4_i1.p1  ORF type:complete len:435 (-),score=65.17 TRINITY_DN1396_c0_g4_i1:78-1382(-)
MWVTILLTLISSVWGTPQDLEQVFKGLHPADRTFFAKFLPSGYELNSDELLPTIESIRQTRSPSSMPPVVIVPSLIGSALDAKLVDSTPPRWFCSRNWDWYRIYLDVTMAILFPECWVHNMQLTYNQSTHSYSSDNGISIRAPGFGNLSGVDYLDTDKKIPIWAGLISVLTQLGYQDGVNLRSAPYDWRIGPDDPSFQQYLIDLKLLIEETYRINGNTKVAVTSLSMGGAVFLLLLSNVDQSWKDQYIHSFTPFSSCFAGSVEATAGLLGSPMFGINPQSLLVGYGSVYWLSPYPTIIPSDKVFVSTPTRNYTISEISDLLRDVGIPNSLEIYRSVSKLQVITPPGVPINCIFGTGVPTIDTLQFSTSNWYQGEFTNTTVPGDGTCSHQSLDLCRIWATQQSQPSNTFEIPNMVHSSVMSNSEAFQIFLKILLN